MPRKNVVPSGQLSLEELVDGNRGELVQWPVDKDDIGGELVAVLTKGLYTDPLDCVREYVQNAVDARCGNVRIKVTGHSVVIFDDGDGMSLDELRRARQFGVSPKSLSDFVGFRGIGIYSGYDLCQRLRISTKREGETYVHVLVFDFALMHSMLATDGTKPSLLDLLTSCTAFEREVGEYPIDTHFTQVDLQDLSDVHIRQLSDRTSMRRYLLQNLPIDFADVFDHRAAINGLLAANVPGYSPIRIKLESDGLEDETVVKDAIAGLQPPTSGWITTSKGIQIAYYWACLNGDRRALEVPGPAEEQRPSYAGFVYKIKGFTVGNREKLRRYFEKRGQLYPWYTGEIYIVDPNVVPNAERNDFETNTAKQALELAVNDKLKELERAAIQFQARGVADERVSKYSSDVTAYENEVRGGAVDTFATFSALDSIKIDLKRQKREASPENQRIADDLLRRIEKLQREIRTQVDAPIPEAKRRQKAAQTTGPEMPVQVILPLQPTQPTSSLREVASQAGFSGDDSALLEILQGALDASLGRDDPAYARVIREFERILSSPTID